MVACLCPAIVRSYCWLICDVAVTYVHDGQTESARPRARAYKYPVIGSIQHTLSRVCVELLPLRPPFELDIGRLGVSSPIHFRMNPTSVHSQLSNCLQCTGPSPFVAPGSTPFVALCSHPGSTPFVALCPCAGRSPVTLCSRAFFARQVGPMGRSGRTPLLPARIGRQSFFWEGDATALPAGASRGRSTAALPFGASRGRSAAALPYGASRGLWRRRALRASPSSPGKIRDMLSDF